MRLITESAPRRLCWLPWSSVRRNEDICHTDDHGSQHRAGAPTAVPCSAASCAAAAARGRMHRTVGAGAGVVGVGVGAGVTACRHSASCKRWSCRGFVGTC